MARSAPPGATCNVRSKTGMNDSIVVLLACSSFHGAWDYIEKAKLPPGDSLPAIVAEAKKRVDAADASEIERVRREAVVAHAAQLVRLADRLVQVCGPQLPALPPSPQSAVDEEVGKERAKQKKERDRDHRIHIARNAAHRQLQILRREMVDHFAELCGCKGAGMSGKGSRRLRRIEEAIRSELALP